MLKFTAIFAALFAMKCSMAEENQAAAETKESRFLSKDYDEDTGDFWFILGNGERIEGSVNSYSPQIQKQLSLHGVMQKAGDSVASCSKSRNYTQAAANINQVLSGLSQGQWETRGEGERGPRVEDLAEAIARLKNIPQEQALVAVNAAPEEKRKEWRNHPQIKHALSVIRTEKLAKEVEGAGQGFSM